MVAVAYGGSRLLEVPTILGFDRKIFGFLSKLSFMGSARLQDIVAHEGATVFKILVLLL